jgi:hypothetical protein
VVPHKDEIIAVLVDNVFIKHLKEAISSPQVLVWAEVYEDGSDDPKKAYTKILFNGPDQPEGVQMGLANRIIYGPTMFKGFPIRIRFFIVELDKRQKETASAIIQAVGAAAAAAKPEAAPAINVAVQFAESINALNQDDYELRYDVTLSPLGAVGRYRVADTELSRIGEPIQREGKEFGLVTSSSSESSASASRASSGTPPLRRSPLSSAAWTGTSRRSTSSTHTGTPIWECPSAVNTCYAIKAGISGRSFAR